jgi:EXS family
MSVPDDQQVQLTDFSEHFPLPLRVLSLLTLGAYAFASNLHLLRLLGLDAAFIFDFRLPHEIGHTHIHPSRLYPPIYHLALSYTAFTAAGWLAVQFWPAYGDRLSAVWLAIGLLAAGWPFRSQRAQLLGSLRRVFFDGLWTPVSFGQVIFGDILTSFAKVLGEIWVVFVAAAGVRVGWGEPLMIA